MHVFACLFDNRYILAPCCLILRSQILNILSTVANLCQLLVSEIKSEGQMAENDQSC